MLKAVFGGLRSVAGHQLEQADAMLTIEAMKSSANIITDVSRQCGHYTGKLWDRDKCVAKQFQCDSMGEEKCGH